MTKIITKAEILKKIKLLRPEEGDILVVPSEANINLNVLSVLLKGTPIKYGIVVPEGNVKLMKKEEAVRFANKYLSN